MTKWAILALFKCGFRKYSTKSSKSVRGYLSATEHAVIFCMGNTCPRETERKFRKLAWTNKQLLRHGLFRCHYVLRNWPLFYLIFVSLGLNFLEVLPGAAPALPLSQPFQCRAEGAGTHSTVLLSCFREQEVLFSPLPIYLKGRSALQVCQGKR